MKRTLSKLLALVLIVTVIGAMAAVPAMASESPAAFGGYTAIGGTTNFNKNLVINSDANVPNVTFSFAITDGTAVDDSGSAIQILASGATLTGVTPTVTFTGDETTTAGKPGEVTPSDGYKYATLPVTITFPEGTFAKPGVYRFKLTETEGTLPGITYDESTLYLDVFVVADDSDVLSIASCILRPSEANISLDGVYASDPDVKTADFTNQVTQFDFEFTKTIAGNQGDKSKVFTFTLNVSNALPGSYPVVVNNVTGAEASITVGEDGKGEATFSMTHNSSVKVVGLNKGARCVVTEANEDYTPSYLVDEETEGTTNTSTVNLINSGHKVDFTNTRTGVIPTGILLTVAPFAVGLLLFGSIVIFLAAKKRRAEDED